MTVNGLSGSYYQYQNTLNMLQLSNARQTSRYQAVEPVNRVSSAAVSYTHLDVYKRQASDWSFIGRNHGCGSVLYGKQRIASG